MHPKRSARALPVQGFAERFTSSLPTMIETPFAGVGAAHDRDGMAFWSSGLLVVGACALPVVVVGWSLLAP
jgi:hypothetical protein